MRRQIILILIYALTLAVFCQQTNRTYKVCGDNNYPPYEYLNDKNQPAGFNIELIKAVAKEMELEIDIKLGPWNQVRTLLENGKIDILSGMYYSEERDQNVDFSIPLCMISGAVFSRKGSKVHTLEDTKGRTILVQNGDILHDYAKNLSDRNILAFENPEQVLEHLASGEGDAAFLSKLQGLYWKEKLHLMNIEPHSLILEPRRFCFAVKNNDRELLAKLNEGLTILKKNGTYDKIYLKHFGIYEPVSIKKYYRAIFFTMVLMAIIALLILLWNQQLRKKVSLKTTQLQKELEEHQATTRALQAADYKFQMLRESLQDGFIRCNEQLQIIEINPIMLEMLGYQKEEILGTKIEAITPSDFFQYERESIFPSVQERGFSKLYHKEFLHKDGHSIEVELRIHLEKEHQSQSYWAIVRTLSEQDRAQEELTESRRKMQTLISNLPGIVYRCKNDTDWTMLFLSKGTKGLLGYRPEELLKNKEISYGTLIDTHFRNYVNNDIQTALKNHTPYILEYPVYTKSSERKWVHERGIGVYNEDNELIALEGFIQDITEQRQATEQIEYGQIYLNTVFNSITSILIAIDGYGFVTQWNKAAEKFTSIKKEDAQEKFVWELIPSLENMQDELLKEDKRTNPVAKNITDKKNRILNIELYHLDHKNFHGTVIRIDDITKQENIETQLRQAQKMETIGTLAGGLAHDFNNMLGGIIGTLSLLRYSIEEGSLTEEELVENLNIMDKSSAQASEMVQRLLTISRRHEISFITVQLNEIIQHTVEICRNSLDKRVDIQVHFSKENPSIEANPSHLGQILLNVCINAIHAMTIMKEGDSDQGGILEISTEEVYPDAVFLKEHAQAEEIAYWKIVVKDSGIGIKKGNMDKIFDPFYTTKDKEMGTGLGLSMVYNIVKQYHGFIQVESASGKGTTFSIYFPKSNKDQSHTRINQDKEKIVPGSGRILIIDDETVIRKLGVNILSKFGYEVDTAIDGIEGIEQYRTSEKPYDLVILDMSMPKLSGRDTYLELKAINPTIKVLLASGFKQDERVQEVMELGVNEYLQKPFTAKKLIKTVQNLL